MVTAGTLGLERLASITDEPAGPGKNAGVGFRLSLRTEHGKRQPMSEVSDDNASSSSLAAVDQQWRTAGGSPQAKKLKTCHVSHAAADRETCSSSGHARTLGPQQAAGLALDQQQTAPFSRVSTPMGPPAPPASAAAGPGMPRLGSLLVAAQMATDSSVGQSSGVSPLLPATQATLRATTASVIAAEVLAAVSGPMAGTTTSPAVCSALVAKLLAGHRMDKAGSPSAAEAASMDLIVHAQQQQQQERQQGPLTELLAPRATTAAGSQVQHEQLPPSPVAAAVEAGAAGYEPMGAFAEAAAAAAPAAAVQQEGDNTTALPAAAAPAALLGADNAAAPCSSPASTAVLQDKPAAGQVELPSWLREPSAELQAGMAICKASLATATAALTRLRSPRGLCMQAAAAAGGAVGPSMHGGMLGLSVTAAGGVVMSPAQHRSPASAAVGALGASWSAQGAAAAASPAACAHGGSSPAAISPVGPWPAQGAAAASPAARAHGSSSSAAISPAAISPAALSPMGHWPAACLSPPPPPQQPVPVLQLPAAALPAQTAAAAMTVFGVPARERPADAVGMVWGLPFGPAAAAAAAAGTGGMDMQCSPSAGPAGGSPGAELCMRLAAVKTVVSLDPAADCEMGDAGSCSSTPKAAAAAAAACAGNAAAGRGLAAVAAKLAVYKQPQQLLCSPSVGGGCSSVALTADDASSPLLTVSDEDVSSGLSESGLSEGGSASAVAGAVVVHVAIKGSRLGSAGTASAAAGVKPKQQEEMQGKTLVSG